MPNIIFLRADLFDSSTQTLTNTVNTVGIMGAGIAKQFKARFPAMFQDYKARCGRKEIQTGEPYLWKGANGDGTWVLNFPTKRHWRGNSKIEWIEQGLVFLMNHYREWNIRSLAMPALGCSLGGLNWDQVKPLMVRYLEQMDIPVEIYEPRRHPMLHKEVRPPKRKTKTFVQPELF